MRRIIIMCILLTVWMSSQQKEIDMAVKTNGRPLQDQRTTVQNRPTGGGYGGFQTPTTGTNRPPAWLGRNPLSGANAGGGSGQNNSTAWDALTSAMGAANTGGGGSGGNGWISMEQPSGQQTPANQPAFANPPVPRVPVAGFQTPAYGTNPLPAGTRGDPTGSIANQYNNRPAQNGFQPPAWLRSVASAMGAVNTGGGGSGGNGWISMDQPGGQPSNQPPAQPAFMTPLPDSAVDAAQQWLENMGYVPSVPTQPAGPVPTYPASSTRPPGGFILPATEEVAAGGGGGGGFGTTYGGNWRPRRGGGGGYGGYGGGGGYGGDEYPAWMNTDMGLYSWKFGQ